MSHVIDEDETYTYEIFQEKHLEESTKLLADTFTKNNPLEVYMKTTYEQFYAQALSFSKAVVNEQLSIVAVHKQTKEIHGLVQAGDKKKMEEHTFEGGEPGKDPEVSNGVEQQKSEEGEPGKDVEVFNELEKRFTQQYGEVKENELVQIMMVGVRSDCNGKGLGTKLQQVLFAHCRQRGFKHAVVEPANPASYHIYANKLNGKVLTSIDLPTFVSSDGQRPFQDYNGSVQVILFDL